MFSREYLQQSATETGFRPDTLERVLRLERLLGQVRRHPFLRDRLALKEGTALNLFFGGPVPRLSVDLDFNYVRPVERAEMLREKPEVERAVATIAEGDRYRLQWGREEHAGRTLYLGSPWYLRRSGTGGPQTPICLAARWSSGPRRCWPARFSLCSTVVPRGISTTWLRRRLGDGHTIRRASGRSSWR